MAKTAYNILEEIFTNQITVMNIAVPTASLDLEKAREICGSNNFNVHLIKEMTDEDLKVYSNSSGTSRPLCDSEVISESTPLLDVIDILCHKEQVFVKVKRNITHIVTRSDLDTIPVRIWLYGMISLFEIELKDRITQMGIDWEKKLSADRLDKAKELFQQKKLQNEEITLLGCTQLCDLATIVLKFWKQFEDLFPSNNSKKRIQSSFINMKLIRNALAHGQKLQLEWPEILSQMQMILHCLGRIDAKLAH